MELEGFNVRYNNFKNKNKCFTQYVEVNSYIQVVASYIDALF